MIHLAASQTTTIIIVSAVGAAAFVLTTMLVVLVFLAVFEGGEESTNDVQHVIEPTDVCPYSLARASSQLASAGRSGSGSCG